MLQKKRFGAKATGRAAAYARALGGIPVGKAYLLGSEDAGKKRKTQKRKNRKSPLVLLFLPEMSSPIWVTERDRDYIIERAIIARKEKRYLILKNVVVGESRKRLNQMMVDFTGSKGVFK